jgi:hypothetical protein
MRVTSQVTGFDVHEYIVPGPAYGKDVEDAFRLARESMAELGIDPSFDDALTVEGRDEGTVVVWFKRERGHAADNLNADMALAWNSGYAAGAADAVAEVAGVSVAEGALNPYLSDAVARRDRRARGAKRAAVKPVAAQDAVTGE